MASGHMSEHTVFDLLFKATPVLMSNHVITFESHSQTALM